ncbi:uncharacterized protein LOC131677793 isoform X2 [Topomyia yanbarensis]|uniref:uncharacterized protein LOC131677793 isoform X2 n=1 Tax=Topomyia yanbarensis TaxID=2498891 RepID=UPI00273AD6A7|nr:uncharacterized protein LOC131677793 isoform X2 [Topomyia yanbarensis]
MAKQHRFSFVFLLLIIVHLIDATIPALDNIVLQSPGFQQLVAADPMVSSDESSPTNNVGADKTKTQKDSALSQDINPTLKLVTRVLDTLRSPTPAQTLLRVPQLRALPGCPLCDASVYSYCDYKVYHDGCCCGTINGAYGPGGGFGGIGSDGIGYGGCGYQEDCSFIYANSCYEHQLIVNCCCNVPF